MSDNRRNFYRGVEDGARKGEKELFSIIIMLTIVYAFYATSWTADFSAYRAIFMKIIGI